MRKEKKYGKRKPLVFPIFQKLKIFADSLEMQNKETLDFSKPSLSEETNTSMRFVSNIQTSRSTVSETWLKTETRTQDMSNTHSTFTSKEVDGTNPKPAFLTGYSKIQELKLVKIGLASSDKIVGWAEKTLPNGKIFGEVLNANTLHYKTFKPHKGGLFCERIFGPLKDFECACGIKQKPFENDAYVENILNAGVFGSEKDPQQLKRIFCTNCDVEYTWSVIRRYQLGYIQLVSPVSHLWYLRTNPSYLSLLLDIRKTDLESIIYCMQTTTLEYYWRPLYSLNINISPASLLNSYQQFFPIKVNSLKTKKNLLKMPSKKQRNEISKRTNLEVSHKRIDFNLNFEPQLQALENQSLEKKIQYLEKSFQLSSDDYYPNKLEKLIKIQNFLKQKKSKKNRKEWFVTIYKKMFKILYKEIYRSIATRSFRSNFYRKKNYVDFKELMNLDKKNKFLVKTKLIINQNSVFQTDYLTPSKLFEDTSMSSLTFTLKTWLKKNSQKNQTKQQIQKFFLFSNSRFPCWENPNSYSYNQTFKEIQTNINSNQLSPRGFHSLTLKNRNLDLTKNKTMNKQKIFLDEFLILVGKIQIQRIWTSILKKKKQSIQFISKLEQVFVYNPLAGNSKNIVFKKILTNTLFLYILFLIQVNRNAFFTIKPCSLTNLEILEYIILNSTKKPILLKLFPKANFTKFRKKKKEFQIIYESLQKNTANDEVQTLLQFLNLERTMNFTSVNNEFMAFLNIWLHKMTLMFIKIGYSQRISKYFKVNEKRYKIFFVNSCFEATFWMTKDLQTSKIWDKPSKVAPLKKATNLKISKQIVFQNLLKQKKMVQFSKNQQSYYTNFSLYNKNYITTMKKLTTLKPKNPTSSVNLFNNIYTVAYSYGWEADRDWKYFIYYNTAPMEIQDNFIDYYKYRMLSNEALNYSLAPTIPVIGANFVQKLLFQYEGLELRKMAKQHQNLLPKLNRYIRFFKQKNFTPAKKKSEFVQIQKLLQKRDQIVRRLKLLRKLFKKNSKTSSMILNMLPVLPPDLRPILKMQNQIAASDLNRFYQRILYRNSRLKKFLRANSSLMNSEPGFELKYAQRLLQEAVDNLIQNGKGHVKPETNSRGQPLKSLSEVLKGKQGRFRQYLLGKRVDYSGRSVIVVGPRLKLYECGLPFEMAIELFLPFLIKRIFQYRLARTVIGSKTILKTKTKITWNLLEEVMQNHPILLNRAPTLHRLGIQAFQPKLIEGRAILLHPLVCPAFNADFDGDQMAVHVPITVEARTEAWKLMFSRNHLISPATGDAMLLPSQDMVLGCYYLTTEFLQKSTFHKGRPFNSGTSFYFSNMQQVLQSYLEHKIHLQTPIWMKWNGLIEMEHHSSQPLEIRLDFEGFYTELRPKTQKRLNHEGLQAFFVRTTAGRVLINKIIQNCIQSY